MKNYTNNSYCNSPRVNYIGERHNFAPVALGVLAGLTILSLGSNKSTNSIDSKVV